MYFYRTMHQQITRTYESKMLCSCNLHTITTITAHKTTNDSYESMLSGSCKAAIMLKLQHITKY